MKNIYNHYTLKSFLASKIGSISLKEIAKVIGCSYQKVHFATRDKQHWIYADVKRWRKAFGMHREEGDYFEILALVAAYQPASGTKRQKMLERVLVLVDRFETNMNPEQEIANSLIYWLDPFISILRNLTDLDEFPAIEAEIPPWVCDKLIFVGAIRKIPKKKIQSRISRSWNWLKEVDGVAFVKSEQRWEKTIPLIISKGKLDTNLKDVQSTLLLVQHLDALSNFTLELGSSNMVGNVFSTFVLPDEHVDILNGLMRDFVIETTRNLNFACNPNFLEELRQFDEEYYQEVLAFKKRLEIKGIKIPPAKNISQQTLLQLLVTARKLIK